MRRFSSFIALLLLALWLPTTQHCMLEAAEFVQKSCHEQGAASDQKCAADECATLESAQYRLASTFIQVVAPEWHDCLCLLCLKAPEFQSDASIRSALTASEYPRDWVPTWHFVRRAAPPSRAPTSLCA